MLKVFNVSISRWKSITSFCCPNIYIGELFRIGIFYSPISRSINFDFKKMLKIELLVCGEQYFVFLPHLIVPYVLQQLNLVPGFNIEVDILPFITIISNLCSNLNESSLIGHDCWYSVSDCTTVVICPAEAEKFRPFSTFQIATTKRVDIQIESDPIRWTPSRKRSNTIIVDSG